MDNPADDETIYAAGAYVGDVVDVVRRLALEGKSPTAFDEANPWRAFTPDDRYADVATKGDAVFYLLWRSVVQPQ